MSDFMALLVATVPFFEFLCAFISFCDKLHKAPLYDKSNQTVQRTRKQTQPAPNSVFKENKLLPLFSPLFYLL